MVIILLTVPSAISLAAVTARGRATDPVTEGARAARRRRRGLDRRINK